MRPAAREGGGLLRPGGGPGGRGAGLRPRRQAVPLALELWPAGSRRGASAPTRLGDALANAGRGAEAAREYLAAAGGADAAETLELRRRAAMQLLISGHIDQGSPSSATCWRRRDDAARPTPRRAFWLLVRARSGCASAGWLPTGQCEVRPRRISSGIDICWTAVAGLSMVDPIRGAGFQTRGLLLALKAGETSRVVRAMAVEAAHLAVDSGPDRRRAARLVQVADEIVQRRNAPHALGMIAMARGLMAFMAGPGSRASISVIRPTRFSATTAPGLSGNSIPHIRSRSGPWSTWASWRS